jgi:hypothetical protein
LWWKEIAVEVNGLPEKPSSVMVDGKSVACGFSGHAAKIVVDDRGDGVDIVVR